MQNLPKLSSNKCAWILSTKCYFGIHDCWTRGWCAAQVALRTGGIW